MNKTRRTLFAALALAALGWLGLGAAAAPAPAASSSLTVSTVNSAGKPVAGALVTVFSGGATVAQASTDSKGKVTFSLAPGSYSLFASKVIVVSGFPSAIYGSANATVSAKPSSVTVVLSNSAP